MSISIGKMVGTGAIALGAATLGVGVGGDNLANLLSGHEGLLGKVGELAGNAHEAVGGVAETALTKLGIADKVGKETAVGIAGGALAAGGGLLTYFSGSNDEEKRVDELEGKVGGMQQQLAAIGEFLKNAVEAAQQNGAMPPAPTGGRGGPGF